MLINNITLNLRKNTPAIDGTAALEYRQPVGTYPVPRGVILNLDKTNKTTNPFLFILSDEQKMAMKNTFKIGIYKQLHKNGFLNNLQLNRLLEMQAGGELSE